MNIDDLTSLISFHQTKRSEDHSVKKRRPAFPDILLIVIALVPVVFSAWARGGTLREFMVPFPWIIALCFFLFLLVPYWRETSFAQGCAAIREQIGRMLRDPVFYLGVLFVIQLTIQWWNSGKVRVLDPGTGTVTFCPPYIEWLPGAVDYALSKDMIVWYLPAIIVLLIIRHGFSRPEGVRVLFWGMTINVSLLAIFGFIAPLLAKNYPSWLTPVLPKQKVFFFSTFGYPNHAGSFFVLHLGLACGLFCYYFKKYRKNDEPWERKRAYKKSLIILSVMTLLLAVAVHMTRSRFATLFSWPLLVGFFVYLGISAMVKSPARRRKMFMAFLLAGSLFVMAGAGFYFSRQEGLPPRVSFFQKVGLLVQKEMDIRFWQTEAAAKIWLDYPVFGVGGGAFREYLLQYVKNPKKREIAVEYWGMTNVHNDYMQFLCEFGIVGFGLITGIVFLMILPVATKKRWKRAEVFFGLFGLLGVSIHALIDLPLRSPPIVISFILILAGYGVMIKPGRKSGDVKTTGDEKPVGRSGVIYFWGIMFLLLVTFGWRVLEPLRRDMSRSITMEAKKRYNSQLLSIPGDAVSPPFSKAASPVMLSALKRAAFFYDRDKELYLLMARINFDLYRMALRENGGDAAKYLKNALRSVLGAKRFTAFRDLEMVQIYSAILDALGYRLEQSWSLKCLGDAFPGDSRISRLLEEYYRKRPYLFR